MIIQATLGPTFPEELHASGIPLSGLMWRSDGVLINDNFDLDHLADLKALLNAHDPTKPLPPAPGSDIIVLDKMALYQKMTDAEYTAMKAGVAAQSERVQDIFNRADTFRSDAALWPLLVQMAHQLYGDARAAELLAP